MKASYNWLKEFVAFDHSPEELADLMTRIGLNVEGIDEVGITSEDVVIGKVLTCEPVPKTDHLSCCEVDVGSGEPLTIICGAPNVAAGQIVPVALVGAELPGGFRIEKRKIRGVVSTGMICSECELGISDEAEGIMVLDDPPLPPPTIAGGEKNMDDPPLIPPYNSRGGEGESPWRIGAPLTDYIGRQDWIFDIEVTINRPDCLSHLGMAREISAATGIELKMPEFELDEVDDPTAEQISIDILAPDKCPRYSARMVTGVEVKPSPLHIQERLRNLDVRPISNIVDVTNYVLLELGHPLHAFDYHLIADGRIIVRTADEGEMFMTLDEKEYTLAESDLLIADPEKGIALAGVMGGLNSEIQDDTEDVLLECAYFDPVTIRITSRDHGISSESSYRFERGVDPEMTSYAVDRAAYLIQQFAGGRILKGIVDNYPKPWSSKPIKLRPERVNKLLATDIQTAEMEEFLTRLGCRVGSGEIMDVTPPSWRHDLEREIDLIEEVARLYGYDKVESAASSSIPLAFNDMREHRRRLISRFKGALVELGFHEAIGPSLVTEDDAKSYDDKLKPVKLLNPLSEDMSHLRTSLASSLVKAAVRSYNFDARNIRLFEWGKCFWMDGGKVSEGNRLAGLIAGEISPESWRDSTRLADFYDLKGLLEQFGAKISLDNLYFNAYDYSRRSDAGRILIGVEGEDPRDCGRYLRIDPYIREFEDIDFPVWYFELNGDLLLELAGTVPHYKPLPRYPAARRDLAFLMDENLEAGKIEEILKNRGGKYLEAVELFDRFKGKTIPDGKISLAFHLIFRSIERTLSEAEIDRLVEKMVEAVRQEVGAVLRS